MDQDDIATVVDGTDPKQPVIDMRRITNPQFVTWLMLHSISHENIEKAFPVKDGKRSIEQTTVQLVVNGVPVDVLPALVYMHEKYDDQVKAEARKLLKEQTRDRFDHLKTLTDNFESCLKDEAHKLFPGDYRFEEE